MALGRRRNAALGLLVSTLSTVAVHSNLLQAEAKAVVSDIGAQARISFEGEEHLGGGLDHLRSESGIQSLFQATPNSDGSFTPDLVTGNGTRGNSTLASDRPSTTGQPRSSVARQAGVAASRGEERLGITYL
jgi:hypothetical protein